MIQGRAHSPLSLGGPDKRSRGIRIPGLSPSRAREPFKRLWSIDPLELRIYQATSPLLTNPRTSWFTLAFWEQLLDENKPEPWAPARKHLTIDLREPVRV